MPITQQSQIDLLRAAQDWRYAFFEFRRLVRSSADLEEIRLLLKRNNYDFLMRPVETEKTIARTEEHISKTKSQNDWRRRKRMAYIEDPELLLAARAAGFSTVKEFIRYQLGPPPEETDSIENQLQSGEQEKEKSNE